MSDDKVAKLTEQVNQDLRIPSSNLNPSLPKTEGPAPSAQTVELKEQIVTPPDTEVKAVPPSLPVIDKKYKLALIYEKAVPLLVTSTPVSTFVPSAVRLYEIVNYLDSCISSNEYFLRLGFPWHPFISRLYFGMLFYYQTLRAMKPFNRLSQDQSFCVSMLEEQVPPSSLAIPGPLLPIFKSITACEVAHPCFKAIAPAIQDATPPPNAGAGIPASPQIYLCPNLPILCWFANSLIIGDNIPDYTDPTTFNNTVAHTINGFEFPANDWTLENRTALLQPGLYQKVPTTEEIDLAFHSSGANLEIPIFNAVDNLQRVDKYSLLFTPQFLANCTPMMSTYSKFFKEAGNLGECSPTGPQTGAVRVRQNVLTSHNAATNIINTCTSAFNGTWVYTHQVDVKSFEPSLPPLTKLMGQYSGINTLTSHLNIPSYNGNNANGQFGRAGHYWTQSPSLLVCVKDSNFLSVREHIERFYYIEQPSFVQ